MKPFDPLPISRRVLWVHTVGPIIVSAALGAGIALTIFALNPRPFTQVWYVGALVSIGVRAIAHWLPLPTAALWILCIMCWIGSYLVLERVFSMIEFPRKKTMNRFAEEY
jgi:hypothetical protein